MIKEIFNSKSSTVTPKENTKNSEEEGRLVPSLKPSWKLRKAILERHVKFGESVNKDGVVF